MPSDEQQPALATNFNDMVDKTVDKIVNNPEAFKNLVNAQGQQLINSNKDVIEEFQKSNHYKTYIESFDSAARDEGPSGRASMPPLPSRYNKLPPIVPRLRDGLALGNSVGVLESSESVIGDAAHPKMAIARRSSVNFAPPPPREELPARPKTAHGSPLGHIPPPPDPRSRQRAPNLDATTAALNPAQQLRPSLVRSGDGVDAGDEPGGDAGEEYEDDFEVDEEAEAVEREIEPGGDAGVGALNASALPARTAAATSVAAPLPAANIAPPAARPAPALALAKVAQDDGGGGVMGNGGGGVGAGGTPSPGVQRLNAAWAALAPAGFNPSPTKHPALASEVIVLTPDALNSITELIGRVVTDPEYKNKVRKEILYYLNTANSGLYGDLREGVDKFLVTVAKKALNDILKQPNPDPGYDLTKENVYLLYNTDSETPATEQKQESIKADVILRNLKRQIHLNSSIISYLSSRREPSITYLQTEINNVGILKILEECIKKVEKKKSVLASVLPSVFTDFYNKYIKKFDNFTKILQHMNNPSTTLVIVIEQMIDDLLKEKKKISVRYVKASEKYKELTEQHNWLLADDPLSSASVLGRADREEFMRTNKDTIDDYTLCTKHLANIIRLEEHVQTIYAYAMAAVMIRENPNYTGSNGGVASFDKIKVANAKLTTILSEQYDYMVDVDIAKREIARNSQGGGGGARTKLIGKRTKKINYYNNKRIKTGLRRTKGRNNGQRRTKGRIS